MAEKSLGGQTPPAPGKGQGTVHAPGAPMERDVPEDHGAQHVLSIKFLAAIFASLVTLTWITVAVTWFDFGALNLWMALGIATLKATLVALFFMHLRWDRPVNGIIFLGSLLFVLLFVGTVLMDTHAYEPQMIPGYAPAMQQKP